MPLLILAAGASGLWWWSSIFGAKFVALASWGLLIFSLQFFRDPPRTAPDDLLAFLSPADGKIVAIRELENDPHVGGPARQVSIFLSVFSIHVQKVPFNAVVDSTTYQEGRFLAAFNHRASDENEQSISYFSTDRGNFTVRQIAGLIARRILTYVETGSAVRRGDRLGYIRFGSRVDIILPFSFELFVKVGDKVKGGESIIGKFET